MSDRLTLLRPDDWHIHLRDGAALANTVGDAARTFGRAFFYCLSCSAACRRWR